MENDNKSYGLSAWLGSSFLHETRLWELVESNAQKLTEQSQRRKRRKQRNIFQAKEQNERPERP